MNRNRSSGPRFIPIAGKPAAGLAQLAPEFEGYPGIYTGLYRIRISKLVNGKETLPARYNTETELGREVAHGTRGSGTNIVFRLKSK